MVTIIMMWITCLLLGSCVNAFQLITPTCFLRQHSLPDSTPSSSTLLLLAQKKGFDKTIRTSTKKSGKPETTEKTVVTTKPSSSSLPIGELKLNEDMNAGERALERMRSKQQEQKEDELRQVKQLRSVDEFIRDDPTAAVIPEAVAMRMGSRMLPFVGIPLFGTMGAFLTFWYLRVYKNLEFATVSVAVVTIALLLIGLLGITFSVLSASWDPDRAGSALGFDELSTNLDSIRDGLKRSRENTLIRERMAGLPDAEINAAINALDKRDEKANRKQLTLEEKLNKELE